MRIVTSFFVLYYTTKQRATTVAPITFCLESSFDTVFAMSQKQKQESTHMRAKRAIKDGSLEKLKQFVDRQRNAVRADELITTVVRAYRDSGVLDRSSFHRAFYELNRADASNYSDAPSFPEQVLNAVRKQDEVFSWWWAKRFQDRIDSTHMTMWVEDAFEQSDKGQFKRWVRLLSRHDTNESMARFLQSDIAVELTQGHPNNAATILQYIQDTPVLSLDTSTLNELLDTWGRIAKGSDRPNTVPLLLFEMADAPLDPSIKAKALSRMDLPDEEQAVHQL